MLKTKNRTIKVSSSCAVCSSKIKEQEASGLLSSLGINIPFINIYDYINKIIYKINKYITNI